MNTPNATSASDGSDLRFMPSRLLGSLEECPVKWSITRTRCFRSMRTLATLTGGFRPLVREHGFDPVFCRKSDTKSKGKIENVVKYVRIGSDYML